VNHELEGMCTVTAPPGTCMDGRTEESHDTALPDINQKCEPVANLLDLELDGLYIDIWAINVTTGRAPH
jgi:hypothetical protein